MNNLATRKGVSDSKRIRFVHVENTDAVQSDPCGLGQGLKFPWAVHATAVQPILPPVVGAETLL